MPNITVQFSEEELNNVFSNVDKDDTKTFSSVKSQYSECIGKINFEDLTKQMVNEVMSIIETEYLKRIGFK